MTIAENKVGKKYGRLTVINRASNRGNSVAWNCKCDCGNYTVVTSGHLNSRHTESCGCMRANAKNLVGKIFGRLTVISRSKNIGNSVYWECKCKCGVTTTVRAEHLLDKSSRSCGCFRQQRLLTHGLTQKPLYTVWRNMVKRCKHESNKEFKYYGGRGIKICDEWLDVSNFISWAEESGWKSGLQIDRIDNDGDYCPENCRFITGKENINNSRLIRSNNTSGYLGVSFSKHRKKYLAQIGGNDEVFNGKSNKCLGLFNTPEEAAEARDRFIIENNLPYRKLQILKRP